ncbi:single-stranded DNA-binding protein [Helicobacter pylori NQ4099]|uniref:Single-stranded DNA-binding protein n=1 Tax=Helicobacter pylori NQ4099 TaxID=992026 RepID=I9YX37_HELPX|nr:single-stranded DNA-binding protein [Helicobacter pylori]EJB28228.1 single-stranded DNA-binding protein [Helicobacter pylori NQ4099]MBS3011510.1 single-stranded DNA-binding protein [Helicobacter pylori]MBS3013787.1 single-stranded DNA-binding protein [Helicobacter pylori]OOP88387.1 single-stranded DNA-binding protein [Helicobacter pylori]OOP88480.1 single-stranded DNA-binding protein [Helicobacter pylori]
MFNKVIMVGRLTRNVELKYLPSGSAAATIGLATSRRFKKQDGTLGEEVCFIDARLFGRTAEIANQYLSKGSSVLIEGRLTYESWMDQTGKKNSRHTITADSLQFMDKKSDNPQTNAMQDSMTHEGFNNAYPANHNASSQDPFSQAPSYAQNAYAKENLQAQPSKYQNSVPEINIDEEEIPF